MHPASGFSTAAPLTGRVFVMGAYVPNGGTHIAYHLGRILHRDFHLDVTAVTAREESARASPFRYDPEFPSISLQSFEDIVAPDDLLICNPSFSSHHFGLRLDCRKLMYIQGFNTFTVLDGFFDHYVTVSEFVRDFIRGTYGIESRVIPPFIGTPPPSLPWKDRPAHSVAFHLKGDKIQQALLLDRLRALVSLRAPDLGDAIDWDDAVLSRNAPREHDEFLKGLGKSRYLITLSVAEGFGLVPLEAMAQGVVVLGLDGFGGRHYMRSGRNCATAPYPELDVAADELIAVMRSPAAGEALSDAARLTAAQYGYDRFRKAWIAELASAFSLTLPPANAPLSFAGEANAGDRPARGRSRGGAALSNSL
jgi:hypothetical protein